MVKTFRLLIIVYWCLIGLACGEETLEPCPNITNLIEGEAEVNGEKQLLHLAKVNKEVITGLDTYEFLIESIANDCNQILQFRFYATVPNDAKLKGKFRLIESSVYTAFHITSFSFNKNTEEPMDNHILNGISGMATIALHAENEFSIELKALFSEEENEVKLNLRHQF